MHAALQNRDILYDIFDHLVPRFEHSHWHFCTCEPNQRTQRVLYNAALTCKAFSELALKQLWTHVPCFDILLELLPSSAKLVSHAEVPEGEEPIPDSKARWSGSCIWVRGL